MLDKLRRARDGTQFARLLLSRQRLLLIGSHTGHLSGNALGLALAAQASADFTPAFIGEHPPAGLAIAAFGLNDLAARVLLKRADVVAYTGGSTRFEAAAACAALAALAWHANQGDRRLRPALRV